MANEFDGMFSTPEEIRNQRLAALQAQAAQQRGLGGSMAGLLGQVAAGTGGVLAEGIAGAFGLKTAEERQAIKGQEISKNIDWNDPLSIQAGAKAFAEAGLTKSAIKASSMATDLQTQKTKLDFEERRVANLELQTQQQNDQFLKTYDLKLDQFNLDRDKFDAMNTNEKTRLAMTQRQLTMQEQDMATRITDKNKLEAAKQTIATVSYNPEEKDAYIKYNERVAEALSGIGEGGEAAKYLKIADDARNGRLSNAKPVITKIEDVVDPKTGKKGTIILNNGVQTSFYEDSSSGSWDGTLSSTAEKTLRDITDDNKVQGGIVSRANSFITKLNEMEDFGGGVGLTFAEAAKGFLGLRDERSELLTLGESLKNSDIVQYLPKGPASDKDIAMVQRGAPPENAGKAEWLSYMRGVKKMAEAARKYNEDRASWISSYGDERGFLTNQKAQTMEKEIAGYEQEYPAAVQYLVDNPTPETRAAFQQKYGFDYFDAKTELNGLKYQVSQIIGDR